MEQVRNVVRVLETEERDTSDEYRGILFLF